MILTEVTRANAMCWPPFPVIREVSVQRSQHSYTSHWNHWKLFQNIPSSWLLFVLLLFFFHSSHSVAQVTYLFWISASHRKRKWHGLLQAILSSHRGFNVSILDVLTQDVGRPPRGGGSVWSLYMSNTGKTQQLWYKRFFVTISRQNDEIMMLYH